jgi:IS5 family transposase
MLDRVKARLGDKLKVVAADKGYGVRRLLGALWERGLKAHIPAQGKPEEKKLPRLAEVRRRVARLDVFKRQVVKKQQELGRNSAVRASKTKAYELSRRLRLRVEHAIGEGKTCHGLARARYRGLDKLQAQLLLTGAVINLKRLAQQQPVQHPKTSATVATIVPTVSSTTASMTERRPKSAVSLDFRALFGLLALLCPAPDTP